MSKRASSRKKDQSGKKTRKIKLDKFFNCPARGSKQKAWQQLAEQIGKYPEGNQKSWGIDFAMGKGRNKRVIKLAKSDPEVLLPIKNKANYLCFLHSWYQLPKTIVMEVPREGLEIGRAHV